MDVELLPGRLVVAMGAPLSSGMSIDVPLSPCCGVSCDACIYKVLRLSSQCVVRAMRVDMPLLFAALSQKIAQNCKFRRKKGRHVRGFAYICPHNQTFLTL